MKFSIKKDELKDLLGIPELKLPTYASPLINSANGYSNATTPKQIGQLTDFIKQCNPSSIDEWREWVN